MDGNATAVTDITMDYLLPACMVLLTLSLDLKAILGLGSKALILFTTGTFGIVIGGPLHYCWFLSSFLKCLVGQVQMRFGVA